MFVIDQAGNRQPARVLLDAGSQINLCTESFAKKLRLNLTKSNIPITGINNTACCATKLASIRIISRYQRFSFQATCAVLSALTHKLPAQSFDINQFNVPDNVYLADPQFNISADIDILLGAQFYLDLILPNKYVRGSHFPTIQETKLGYILAGNLPKHCHYKGPAVSFLARNNDSQILASLEKFWETETIPDNTPINNESACEEHFVKSTHRNQEGRFVVALPFKSDNPQLGESYATAEARFLSLERRFMRDSKLARDYANFIQEYKDLGHMTLIDNCSINSGVSNTYYLPHHAVFKHSSSTTKLRVVFDGSSKTTNGLSLNDILLVGPNVQQDLFSILLRFRMHNYVLIADIEKMYRQILVAEKDCHYQRILWRDSPLEQFKHRCV